MNTDGTPAVQPLNIPPSRARRTLAARLAQRNQDKTWDHDPDAVDAAALEVASELPEEPSELSGLPGSEDLDDGLQITGLRTVSGAGHISRGSGSKFSGLFSSSDSDDSSNEEFDEDAAGRDHTLDRDGGDYDEPTSDPTNEGFRRQRPIRRPSTTEAKERTPLDDSDEDGSEELEITDLDLPEEMQSKLVLNRHEGEDSEEDSSDDDGLVEIRPRRTS